MKLHNMNCSTFLSTAGQFQKLNYQKQRNYKIKSKSESLSYEFHEQQHMAMVLDTKLESEFPYWASVRRRFRPDSPFFASGNIERELLAKQVPFSLIILFL